MAAAPDQSTVDACLAAFVGVIRGAITVGTLAIPPVHDPPSTAPIVPPQAPPANDVREHDKQLNAHGRLSLPQAPPANDVREHDKQLNAHGRLRDFTVARNDVDREIVFLRETKRRMFISVAELLKIHTIPVINDFDLRYVRRLWSDCGWRGYVVYPTEPAADFVTRDPALTPAEVANLVDQIHTFPPLTVNLELYDRPQQMTIHRELYAYGHWVAQVDDHVRQITNLETLYCRAGVRVLSETCLPVVNEADAISVGRLRTEFGCILLPMYPRDCTGFTNVEQHQHVRASAEANGFWIR